MESQKEIHEKSLQEVKLDLLESNVEAGNWNSPLSGTRLCIELMESFAQAIFYAPKEVKF